MELTNTFTVGVPVDEAWRVLTDIERIAPCMPGAQLTEVEGDEYRGTIKVKVGPITAQYRGAARFKERDDAAHRAVIVAEGRDTRGQGTASAEITATLTGTDDGGTRVEVHTDLTVTGKVAQFGRGVLADVSAKLLDQFVACLEADVLSGAEPEAPGRAEESTAGEATTGTGAETGGVRRIDSPEAEPVDLLDAAGGAVAKRVLPVIGVIIVLLVLRRLLRRR